jgi:hypothetical protein
MDSHTATPPTPAPAAPPATAPGDDALRIVLFGRPATGKSSLLGALAEASASQTDALGGKLLEESAGLAELRRQLYETAGRVTASEIVPYPVRYYPSNGTTTDAVLIDCDGRIAGDMLMSEAAIDEAAPEGSLAREVSDADTLLLVTDASADTSQLDADFAEFGRFLRLMEASRGERTEVGGLPVYLVLTKCDLLARATDNSLDWKDRIEQRKQEVGDRFREFLASRAAGAEKDGAPHPGFGRIELVVWATAVKRPVLLGSAAKPREPYGVAELFRQALHSASAYRASWDRSEQRLRWLVAASAMLVLLILVFSVVFLLVSRGIASSHLTNLVEELQFGDQEEPAQRLRGGVEALRRRLDKFREARNDTGFEGLPEKTQDWVKERYQELKEYLDYYERLLQQPSPASERTEEGLNELIRRLNDKGDLALPPAFKDTTAGVLHQRALDAANAIQTGVAAVKAWFFNQSGKAIKLEQLQDDKGNITIDWADWAGKTEELVAEMLPYTRNKPLPGAEGLTYATPLQFREVVQAQAEWETRQAQLRALLDVCTALGKVPDRPGRDMLKVYARFPLGQAAVHLQKLRTEFPDYKKTFTLKALPLGGREVVARLAKPYYDNLIECGRTEVLRQLKNAGKGKEETLARWKPVREWLKAPVELAEWRELAMVLLKLQKETPVGPVEELAAFLAKDQFIIEFRSVALTMPRRLEPDRSDEVWADWTVLHEGKAELVFRLSGSPIEDEAKVKPTRYNYELKKGTRIVYKPGGRMEARLPLKKGKELVWAGSRSRLYQFECLITPPREVKKGDAYRTGLEADGVKLQIRGEGALPAIPDLLPRVRLDD